MALDPNAFVAAYERYVAESVRPAETALRAALESWREPAAWAPYRSEGTPLPNPIQRIKIRIKRPESVIDKMKRLGSREFPKSDPDRAVRNMRDLLGARIVTYVPLHLKMVDQMIRESSSLRLCRPEPRAYLATHELERIGLDPDNFFGKTRKPSGYSSLHYFLQARLSEGDWSIPFELQARTMIEEAWGEIEHQLGYKSGQRTEFSVSRQFRVIGSHLSAIDEHFDFLYDRLGFLQTQAQAHDSDALNAENLPTVLNSHEIPLAQDEIGSLLQILVAWGVRTVGDLRARLTDERLEMIRRVVRAANTNGPATAFHVLTSVAMVGRRASLEEVERQLRTNLAMVQITRKTRRM
ncbi:GTP pyrophosphokinase [Nocardioides dilutus]